MAQFKITPTTTVAELKEQFSNEVGGVLRVYDGRSEAADGATLVLLGAKEGKLECRTSRTVGKFEEAFQNDLNLKVKVYTKDNWVKVLDGITLATAAKLPRQMTKEKMEEYLSYQRDEKEETADTGLNALKSKKFNPDDYNFCDGLARVEINGKYGFIDKLGNIVIEPKFDWVGWFDDGLAKVVMNGKYGFIGKLGNIVIEPKFDYAGSFVDGLAEVKMNGKVGFVDKLGNIVTEPKFDEESGFDEDIAEENQSNTDSSSAEELWAKSLQLAEKTNSVALALHKVGDGFNPEDEWMEYASIIIATNGTDFKAFNSFGDYVPEEITEWLDEDPSYKDIYYCDECSEVFSDGVESQCTDEDVWSSEWGSMDIAIVSSLNQEPAYPYPPFRIDLIHNGEVFHSFTLLDSNDYA